MGPPAGSPPSFLLTPTAELDLLASDIILAFPPRTEPA
jgi:hypothetical protein